MNEYYVLLYCCVLCYIVMTKQSLKLPVFIQLYIGIL